jgi:hypothetical protein
MAHQLKMMLGMKRRLQLMLAWSFFAVLTAVSVPSVVAAETSPSKVDLLAFNRVHAVFKGTEHKPCMMRTALCPDRCGHTRDVAVFEVTKYTDYQAWGKYADGKQQVFYLNLNPNDAEDPQHPAILNGVKGLTPGQKVILSWVHLYVTDRGCSTPQRRVLELSVE